MIVVDTNVMVYLLTGTGPAPEAVVALREDPEWSAPVVLLSELRNVLLGLVRRGGLAPADARAIHHDALSVLGDRVVQVPGNRVLEVGIATGLSAYDAEFVVAARALGAVLLTGDAGILAAAPDVARSLT